MYLIGGEEVKAFINREQILKEVLDQLAELDGGQLKMVKDYVRGLKAAERFLNR